MYLWNEEIKKAGNGYLYKIKEPDNFESWSAISLWSQLIVTMLSSTHFAHSSPDDDSMEFKKNSSKLEINVPRGDSQNCVSIRTLNISPILENLSPSISNVRFKSHLARGVSTTH